MKKIVIFFACLLFLVPTAWAGWTGAAADQNISQYTSNSWKSWYCRVVYNPCYDNLLSVWLQDTTYVPYSSTREVGYSISTDFGVTWSGTLQDSLLSADDVQTVQNVGTRPLGIDIDSQGRVYVVWAEAYIDSIEIMISISSDGGHTWSGTASDIPISCLVGENDRAFKPALAVDNNDNIHVVWHERPAGADLSEIMYAKSVDGGLNWSCVDSNKVISFPDSASASKADIAIAPNNDIYVAWDERNDPNDIYSKRIFYGKSTDGGQTFNSETADNPIGEVIRFSADSYIRIDQSGNVHVIWHASRATSSPYYHDVYYTGSTDGGATWSGVNNAILVDFGPDDLAGVYNPALAVTSDGKLACVWNETPGSVSESAIWASYSTDGGATWSGNDEPELISFPGDHPSYRPDIFSGIGDTLHVVWNEGITTNGYYDIHYSKGDTLATGADWPGSISGTVTDGPVPVEGVSVEAVGTDKEDITDADGNYTMANLAAGTYDVSFSHPDFDDTTVTGVVVGPNCNITILDVVFGEGGCDYVVGDVNGSDNYNGLDITYGVNFFKYGSPPPLCDPDCPPCAGWHYCGDVNASCNYNGLDITYGVNYFKYGSPGPQPCADCPPIE
jgi:hypothetical protein